MRILRTGALVHFIRLRPVISTYHYGWHGDNHDIRVGVPEIARTLLALARRARRLHANGALRVTRGTALGSK